jgi:hypothetical protein
LHLTSKACIVIIGCSTNGYIRSNETDGSSTYSYGIYTGCVSYCTVNGQCAGVGCCRVDIPTGTITRTCTVSARAATASWSAMATTRSTRTTYK